MSLVKKSLFLLLSFLVASCSLTTGGGTSNGMPGAQRVVSWAAVAAAWTQAWIALLVYGASATIAPMTYMPALPRVRWRDAHLSSM